MLYLPYWTPCANQGSALKQHAAVPNYIIANRVGNWGSVVHASTTNKWPTYTRKSHHSTALSWSKHFELEFWAFIWDQLWIFQAISLIGIWQGGMNFLNLARTKITSGYQVRVRALSYFTDYSEQDGIYVRGLRTVLCLWPNKFTNDSITAITFRNSHFGSVSGPN